MYNIIVTVLQNQSIIAGFFGIFGSVIGMFATIAVTRREDKRHVREIGLKLAMVNLEQRIKEQQALADETGQIQEVLPLPILVAEAMKAAEIVSNSCLSADEIGHRLADMETFTVKVFLAMKSKKQ